MVHRRDMRHIFQAHIESSLLGVKTRIAAQFALCRRRRCGKGFPTHERSATGIGGEQIDGERCTGARQAEYKCRLFNRRIEQFGVGFQIILNL